MFSSSPTWAIRLQRWEENLGEKKHYIVPQQSIQGRESENKLNERKETSNKVLPASGFWNTQQETKMQKQHTKG